MNTLSLDRNPEINEININLAQLRINYNIVRNLLNPNTHLMAVVKGDACGHGMLRIAKELEECRCDAFGVTHLSEAILLRTEGITLPVHLLAPCLPSQVKFLIEYNIIPMADNLKIIQLLDQFANENRSCATIHIKVNTGLNRYGIAPAHAVEFISEIKTNYPNLNVEGIYTHFQDPDKNPELTFRQIDCFKHVLQSLEEKNLRPLLAHAASSSAITRYPEAHFDMVRCGMLLYGLEHEEGERIIPPGIKPLVTVKALILKIRTIKEGEAGGYGTEFIPTKDTTVAIIGIGYGDGVGRGWRQAIISGRRVPIVNYFMDGLMADITEIQDSVKEYDEAVIIGSQGNENISILEVSKQFNRYAEEQLQSITERVPRKYIP